MSQKNPNITGQVSYTHPSSNSQSAYRATRYLTRRPEHGQEATREADWQELPPEQVLGNPKEFKREANERRRYWREKAEAEGKDLSKIKRDPECSSYIHVVISPARREEYSDEDMAALAAPWTRHRDGTEAPWFGAIHRDADHGPHLHVLVARGKVEKQRELPELRQQSESLMAEREMYLDVERGLERESALEREPEKKIGAEPETGLSADKNPGEDEDHQERRDDGLSL